VPGYELSAERAKQLHGWATAKGITEDEARERLVGLGLAALSENVHSSELRAIGLSGS